MAGGRPEFRHLSRDSSARIALLRGLVTQLIKHEHIETTVAKAKEAQRWADKLITLGKRNSDAARREAQARVYTPESILPKVFGELRERYTAREGGYTRVRRTEPKNHADQADSAILELVDGPRDTLFMMTAMAVARDESLGRESHPTTVINREKVVRYRKDGDREFEDLVRHFRNMGHDHEEDEAAARRYNFHSRGPQW